MSFNVFSPTGVDFSEADTAIDAVQLESTKDGLRAHTLCQHCGEDLILQQPWDDVVNAFSQPGRVFNGCCIKPNKRGANVFWMGAYHDCGPDRVVQIEEQPHRVEALYNAARR